MAGYVFAIGGDENPVDIIRECAKKGVYSTYLSGISPLPFEGTLTDYMSKSHLYQCLPRKNMVPP